MTISGIGSEPSDAAQLVTLNNVQLHTIVKDGPATIVPATITMTADAIQLTNSAIRTDTLGSAPAGNITINATNLRADQSTKITSNTSAEGPGGNISLAAGRAVSLGNGAMISAGSTGLGNAGNITIKAGAQFLSQDASVTTDATQASGGNIFIQATDSIRLVNSQLSTSVQGGPNTSGGNITLDPAVVTLQNSQVLAQAVQGTGGNINIIAGTFLADPTSVVSASSQFGLSGAVNIQSPVSSLSNTLATLPQRPLASTASTHAALCRPGEWSTEQPRGGGAGCPSCRAGGWLMSPMALMADEKSALPDAQDLQSAPSSPQAHYQRAGERHGLINRNSLITTRCLRPGNRMWVLIVATKVAGRRKNV